MNRACVRTIHDSYSHQCYKYYQLYHYHHCHDYHQYKNHCLSSNYPRLVVIAGSGRFIKLFRDIRGFANEALLEQQQVAAMAETIPYEIMTSVSQRVKRVYYQE